MIGREKKIAHINFLFILGVGRSGTTLLLKTLDNSNKCRAFPEARFLIYCIYYFKKIKKITQASVKFILTNIFFIKEKDYTDLRIWNLEKSQLEQSNEQLSLYNDYRNILKEIYLTSDEAADIEKIEYLIDKNPPYSIVADVLQKNLPQSKFIFLHRNYIANYASVKKHKIGAFHNVWFRGLSWNYYNEVLLKFSKNNAACYKLSYENFVNEPKLQLQNICSFLNITYSEELLNSNQRFESYINSAVQKLDENSKKQFYNMHVKNLQEISADSNTISSKSISEEEKQILQFICNNTACKLGYENSESLNQIPFSWKIKKLYWTCVVNIHFFKTKTYFKLPSKLIFWIKRFVA